MSQRDIESDEEEEEFRSDGILGGLAAVAVIGVGVLGANILLQPVYGPRIDKQASLSKWIEFNQNAYTETIASASKNLSDVEKSLKRKDWLAALEAVQGFEEDIKMAEKDRKRYYHSASEYEANTFGVIRAPSIPAVYITDFKFNGKPFEQTTFDDIKYNVCVASAPLIVQSILKDRKIGPLCLKKDGSFFREDDYSDAYELKDTLNWCLKEINETHRRQGKPGVTYTSLLTTQHAINQAIVKAEIHGYKIDIQTIIDTRVYGKEAFNKEEFYASAEALKEVEEKARLPLTSLSFFEVAPGVSLTPDFLIKLEDGTYSGKKTQLKACPSDLQNPPTP